MDYYDKGYCTGLIMAAGHQDVTGEKYNAPEKNCCACGSFLFKDEAEKKVRLLSLIHISEPTRPY